MDDGILCQLGVFLEMEGDVKPILKALVILAIAIAAGTVYWVIEITNALGRMS